MSASVTVTFVFCWTAFVLGVLFAFSPEIKRLVFRKDRLELERYKQQVDKALVEYDEFKKTIYPLLEITLAQIASTGYMGAGPKPQVLVDYIKRVSKIAEKQDRPELDALINAAKSEVLRSYAIELNSILREAGINELTYGYIGNGLVPHANSAYVDEDNIFLDYSALIKLENDISDVALKQRFNKTLRKLKIFYDANFE
ncbi:hypothetical protein [Limosilactobacillus reuteri]|uniref:hypothetical protein n=1 Tax=Limosilactobacillus reuteri TaxID=1598 RepID=UPI002B061206|nr:hypothetical protein [Limosilactobacillus reuteri]